MLIDLLIAFALGYGAVRAFTEWVDRTPERGLNA